MKKSKSNVKMSKKEEEEDSRLICDEADDEVEEDVQNDNLSDEADDESNQDQEVNDENGDEFEEQSKDEEEQEPEEEEEEEEEQMKTFSDFGLDPRLLKSIKQIGWKQPTLVQEQAILFGLESKDVLIKGRTGCGKTAAFLIPLLHNLLQIKKTDQMAGVRALILSPSKELCHQTSNICRQLNYYSSKEISVLDLSEEVQHMKKLVIEKPDIIVATPSRLLAHHQVRLLSFKLTLVFNSFCLFICQYFIFKGGSLVDIDKYLKCLVIDEADLMFGFGYKQDMHEILKFLPKNTIQTFLVSATLNPDIANMKQLFLNNPVLIKLSESERNEKVLHYYMYAEENDKFLLINALFKFKLMTGRTIIFVNTVNRCYKLKLFLEQFGIRSVLLNSELPLTSRCHAIDQFNKGFYDIIIANDEKCLANPIETKRKQRFAVDSEFTVARGIDFQNVNNVINFDFPDSLISYIHRVGRTGRGPHEDTDGTVLSLVNMNEKRSFINVEKAFVDSSNFKKFRFKMHELDSLKYRTHDAHRMITRVAINEARVKEIKRELLNSEKLKSYFEQNTKDWKALKQDKEYHILQPVAHLKHMPDYIIPDSLQSTVKADDSRKRWYEEGDEIPFSIPVKKHKKRRAQVANKNKSSSKRKGNPLRTFRTSSRK